MKFLTHANMLQDQINWQHGRGGKQQALTTIFARGCLPRPQNLICFWGRRIVTSTVQNGETCFFITIINKSKYPLKYTRKDIQMVRHLPLTTGEKCGVGWWDTCNYKNAQSFFHQYSQSNFTIQIKSIN